MKSLGLDGKVSAPAIVRENPLLRVYAAYRSERNVWNLYACRALLASAAPYTWSDVLGVVVTMYPADKDILHHLIADTTPHLLEPVLRYDLSTPELDVTVKRNHLLTFQLTVWAGECRNVSVSGRRSSAILTGTIDSIQIERGVVVIDNGSFGTLKLQRSAFGVCAGSGNRAVPDLNYHPSGLLLSSVPLRYIPGRSIAGAICDPAELDEFQRLYDDVLDAARDPASFSRRVNEFHNRASDLRAQMRAAQERRGDTLLLSRSLLARRLQFTPRGAL